MVSSSPGMAHFMVLGASQEHGLFEMDWPLRPSLLYTNTSAHGAVVYSSDDPCGHHAPLRPSWWGGHHAARGRSSCLRATVMLWMGYHTGRGVCMAF